MLEFGFAALINGYAVPRKQARAIPELRATFNGGSPVPDLAVYRWERVPVDPDGKVSNIFRAPPDIAIEVVSPRQSVPNLLTKCRWFVEHGVEIALVAHPGQEWVRLVRLAAEPQLLRGTDRIDLDAVLPGFELTVDDLFATLYHE